MKIKHVEFAGPIVRPGGAPPGDLVQVAFSGRSNVGKSSLINRLLGRTRTPIAKVSATPGKTQQINFFRVRASRTDASRAAYDPSPQRGEAADHDRLIDTPVPPGNDPSPRRGEAGRGTHTDGSTPAERDIEFFLVDLPGYGYARAPLEVRTAWKPLIERYLAHNPELAGVVQLIDARHGPTRDDLQRVESLATLGLPALFVLTKIDKLKPSERARQVERWTARLGAGPEQVLPFSARTGAGREALLDSLDALLVTAGFRTP